MSNFFDFFQYLGQPESIIRYGGLTLLLLVVFIENGLFFGFFLPGDNLILFSGVFCAIPNRLLDYPIGIVMLLLILSAITGSTVGYFFGRKTGEALYTKKESIFFKKSYITTADAYFKKYGSSTLIMGRFLPVVRTFAPILAGMVKMDFYQFMLMNITGAIAWVVSLAGIGYYLGKTFPEQIQKYSGIIAIALIVITALPLLSKFLFSKNEQ